MSTETTQAATGTETTTEFDLVLRGERILTTAGITAREVGVKDGKIVAIEPLGNNLRGERVIEVGADEVLLPGWWTPTSTSTSRAAPNGKASNRPPRPPPPAG